MSNNQSTQLPALIVDFPSKKTVRFSRMSHMRTFKPIKNESEIKSYTKNDYKHFNLDRSRDIVQCSKMIALKMSSGEKLTEDDVCLCTGLETMLSPDLPRRARKIMKARESHVQAVLSAQERAHQVITDEYIEVAIARVSERSSRVAVARAYNIAVAAYRSP